jgi:phosphatidylglycerophosphatase A
MNFPLWKYPVHALAYGFGTGLAPFAPGTFGGLKIIGMTQKNCFFRQFVSALIGCPAKIRFNLPTAFPLVRPPDVPHHN